MAMSSLVAAPEFLASAATNLSDIGSALNAANAAAAAPTTRVLAGGADEVSAAIADLFCEHAQQYQALAGQVAQFHDQFTLNLMASANSYLSAETVNAHAAAVSIGGSNSIVQSIGSGLLSDLVGTIPGVKQAELLFDAEGPVVVTRSALDRSVTTFVDAVQTGNLGAATAALVDAPASIGRAFLYGQDTVAMPLSLPGIASLTLDIPVGGVLAPLEPISATIAITGTPPFTLTIPGTEVGGIVPALTGSFSGGGGLLGGGLFGG
jgi:hypothetical protein